MLVAKPMKSAVVFEMQRMGLSIHTPRHLQSRVSGFGLNVSILTLSAINANMPLTK